MVFVRRIVLDADGAGEGVDEAVERGWEVEAEVRSCVYGTEDRSCECCNRPDGDDIGGYLGRTADAVACRVSLVWVGKNDAVSMKQRDGRRG